MPKTLFHSQNISLPVPEGPPPYVPTDPDAADFVTRAGITDIPQIDAIDYLVIAAKANGWWTLCDAIYPFVGGTAEAHKENLRGDIFTLTFTPNMGHNNLGITPDPAGSMASTGYIPNVEATAFDQHMSFYSQTEVAENAGDIGADNQYVFVKYGDGHTYTTFDFAAINNADIVVESSKGWFLASKTNNVTNMALVNGVLLDTDPINAPANLSPTEITILKIVTRPYSTKTCSFASIGSGITPAIAALMYEDIQDYQTALGRAIVPETDPDVVDFITRAGLTDPIQIDAIEDLVVAAKEHGWWDLCDYILPAVGGTSTSNAQNLKGAPAGGVGWYPDATGFIYDANGWTPIDGAYNIAFTGYILANWLTGYDGHMSIYSGTPGATGNKDIHVWDNGGPALRVNYAGNTYGHWHNLAPEGDVYFPAGKNGLGHYLLTTRASNDLSIYSGATLLATNTSVWPVNHGSDTLPMSIGTEAGLFPIAGRNVRFATIGRGVPHAIAVAMANDIEAFQVALGRSTEVVVPTTDPDADAFIARAGITDLTQKDAINDLVVAAKANGWWALCDVIYPFVGGTEGTHKENLRANTFMLTFTGGAWTHNGLGIVPGGGGGSALTGYFPNAEGVAFNQHMSYYSQTDVAENSAAIGAVRQNLYPRYSDDHLYSSFDNLGAYTDPVMTDSRGWFLASKTSNVNSMAFKNGVLLDTDATNLAANLSDTQIAINFQTGIAATFSSRTCSFATIGKGISPAIAALMYTDIQAFQVALGRPASTGYDTDAQAFITAAGITDNAQKTAINNLVNSAKSNGWWTYCHVIYPMVGGTAASHAVNLKTPGTFDLTFVGAAIHNASGYKANEGTAHANSHYRFFDSCPAYSGHLSFYSVTPAGGSGASTEWSGVDAADGAGNERNTAMYFQTGDLHAYFELNDVPQYLIGYFLSGNGSGFVMGSRISPTEGKGYYNGVEGVSTSLVANKLNTRTEMLLCGYDMGGGASVQASVRTCAFATLGLGITNNVIAAAMYADIQAFQTALGRQV